MRIKIHKLYTYSLERQFTIMLFMMLVGLVCVYILFVSLTTLTISSHGSLQYQKQALNSKIGDLESEYTALHSTIDRERALSLGFVQPKKEIFAFRQRLVQNNANAF